MYISISWELKIKLIKKKKIVHIFSYNLHKTKVEVFLYKKIREDRVDTIKKIPYIPNSSWFRVFRFRRLVKLGGFWNPKDSNMDMENIRFPILAGKGREQIPNRVGSLGGTFVNGLDSLCSFLCVLSSIELFRFF